MAEQYETIAKFDRIRGGLHDVALFTKPSTVKNVQNVTGKSETFVIETARHTDENGNSGDYVFIEQMDDGGLTRMVLPPKVVAVILSHNRALTTRNRRRSAKIEAARRKAEGIVPGFLRKNKKGK